MSRITSPKPSYIPPPPPLPPPLKPFSVSEPIRKSSTKKSILSKKGSLQEPAVAAASAANYRSRSSYQSESEPVRASPRVSSAGSTGLGSGSPRSRSSSRGIRSKSQSRNTNPSVIYNSTEMRDSLGRLSSPTSSASGSSSGRKRPSSSYSPRDGSQSQSELGEIVRNDVPFFDEEACTDSEDEFSFPCCVPYFSSRYPPNPRPQREWDPSVLPTNTHIPTSIGTPCRRCGREVYLAELHLSSRGAYHTECYKCCLCGKSLDSWSVAEYKGEVFCRGCYRRNFAIHGCGFGIGAGVLQTP